MIGTMMVLGGDMLPVAVGQEVKEISEVTGGGEEKKGLDQGWSQVIGVRAGISARVKRSGSSAPGVTASMHSHHLGRLLAKAPPLPSSLFLQDLGHGSTMADLMLHAASDLVAAVPKPDGSLPVPGSRNLPITSGSASSLSPLSFLLHTLSTLSFKAVTVVASSPDGAKKLLSSSFFSSVLALASPRHHFRLHPILHHHFFSAVSDRVRVESFQANIHENS